MMPETARRATLLLALLALPSAATAPGNTLPELELVTLDGNHLTSADFRGKVVLLDFWGTWCPPCVASIPHPRALASP
jgi:thiol-disulfide isomerase/thioredoxin